MLVHGALKIWFPLYKIATLFLIGFLVVLQSCSNDDDVSRITKENVNGFVQKGPYLNGTAITISELSSALTATGRNFTTQITDNTGTFTISDITLESEFVELRADGFYYNEVVGENSSAQLTMFALADITSISSINVNILSHLEASRVRKLLDDGLSFDQAKDQAQAEVLAIFGITSSTISSSEQLDIARTGEGNAILLAISVILQADRTVADLTELLANISTDITNDGTLDDPGLRAQVSRNIQLIDLAAVRQNLEQRYADLGVPATFGDFESHVQNYVTEEVPFHVSANIREACFESTSGVIELIFTHNTIEGWWPTTIRWLSSFGHVSHCIEGGWESPIMNSEGIATLEMLCQGSYTVEVADENGFTVIASFQVGEASQELSLSSEPQHNSSETGTTGSIDLIVNGGTPPYTFEWSNGATTEDIGALAVGVYNVKVKDLNLCSLSMNVPVYYSFTDARDARDYFAIQIGTQTWMAENLNIGTRLNADSAQTDNSIIEKYCYDNDEANCDVYGALYWATEAVDYSMNESVQGVCPAGWHVPSDAEWKLMESYLGMSATDADLLEWDFRGTFEGDQLSPGPCDSNTGTEGSGDKCGQSGFTGLLAGNINSNNDYQFLNQYGHFWTSTTGESGYFMRRIGGQPTIGRQIISSDHGYSVRCVKD